MNLRYMDQLNNNSVREIAFMLSRQNRKALASASRDLLRALPPASAVRHQRMVHPHRKRKRASSPPNTEHANKLYNFKKKASNASKVMMQKVQKNNQEFYSKHHPDGPYWKMVQRMILSKREPWHVMLEAGDPTTHKEVTDVIRRTLHKQHWSSLTINNLILEISSYFGENGSRPSRAAKRIVRSIVDEQIEKMMGVARALGLLR